MSLEKFKETVLFISAVGHQSIGLLLIFGLLVVPSWKTCSLFVHLGVANLKLKGEVKSLQKRSRATSRQIEELRKNFTATLLELHRVKSKFINVNCHR